MALRIRAKPLPPDHPIFQQGLQVYTPYPARPGYKPPEPKEEPEVEKAPQQA